MPIVTSHRPYSQANPQPEENVWKLFPRKDKARLSHVFEVMDQPMIIVASGLKDDDEMILQVSPNAVDFADFYLHGVRVVLTATNVMIVLRIPGSYRLMKVVGAMYVNVTALPATLTHEPNIPLTLPLGGPPGSIGPQGPRGVPGDEGPQGPAGAAGAQGERGYPGPQGATGVAGSSGPQGPIGEASTVPGPQGPAGVQGAQGVTGADSTVPGPQGPQGVQGMSGDGVPGAQGPQGDAGVQGPQGPQGERGMQGDIGIPGVPGVQGEAGPKGDPGVQGAASTVPGPQGPQGVQGAIGAGEQGPPGGIGPQGPQGVPGTGAQGPQGPPLFVISAVAPPTTMPVGAAWWDSDNGRTFVLYDDGTSKQWVEFIGAPGQNGLPGAQGPAGVQGATGAASTVPGPQGSTGVQGPAGAQGVAGAQGPIGATPPVGGSNTQVLFNDGGVINGAAYVGYQKVAVPKLFVSTDLFLDRSGAGAPTTGLAYFGNANTSYLFQDGSRFQIGSPASGVAVAAKLGVNGGAVTPTIPFQVHSGSPYLLGVSQYSNLGYWGAWAVDFSANKEVLFHGTAFGPLFDNSLANGTTSNRWSVICAASGVINTSDARLKKDVVDSPLGLAFIETLRPVSYKWIEGFNKVDRVVVGEEEIPEHVDLEGNVIPATTRPTYDYTQTTLPGVRQHFGLIAQEVVTAVKTSGVADFGGIVRGSEAHKLIDDFGVDPAATMGLNYSEFIAPLIKAVQELSARVKALEAQLGIKP